MAAPTSRTVSSSPNTSAQGSPRIRDWSNTRAGEPGSAFRGIGRGRGGRGSGIKVGRGGASSHPGQKVSSQSDTTNSSPSPSSKVSPVSRKPPAPIPTTPTSNGSDRATNRSTERGGRPKPGSRRQSQAVPAVVVAPASPSQTSQTVPSPRSATRRRRPPPTKSSTTTTKPPPVASKAQKSITGSTPTSQPIIRKDVPPHLAAAHEAEIRHDIDALVERVRAVAMADNRPTTPGSHIDWAGDEDDSLPDLDDWGVTTTHTNTAPDEVQSEEISPILADTLKPLPEPHSEVQEEQEQEQEMENYEARTDPVKESIVERSSMHNPMEGVPALPSTAEGTLEQCIVAAVSDDSSSFPHSEERPPLHPSLPPKPIAAMESLRARGKSVSKPSGLPLKPPTAVTEEALTTKTDGLYESIHAPSADERASLERVSSVSSSERGLTGSIHAPVPSLPESQSAPSLLSGHSSSAVQHTHSRSHTESRPGIHQPHTAPPGTASRHGRSGATSPLGKHVYTHSRNHSTPAGSASSRPPQSSRPVITGEAISRLARTIGGIGPTPRAQSIPVTKDSTISP